ncbi:hypothetical protein BBP40_001058 [Aspergillus hancockii]|nr:hypothetical protein BBP40_001058 [Aspergillus hancockii]
MESTAFYVLNFIQTTHNKLKALDAQTLQSGDTNARKEFTDIKGRHGLARALIDSSNPMAHMMSMMSSGLVDFGVEVKAKAKAWFCGEV